MLSRAGWGSTCKTGVPDPCWSAKVTGLILPDSVYNRNEVPIKNDAEHPVYKQNSSHTLYILSVICREFRKKTEGLESLHPLARPTRQFLVPEGQQTGHLGG